MLLRHAADRRSLLWSLVLFPLIPALGYANRALLPWLLPIELYLAYCSGVLIHNHMHCPVFRSRRANAIYAIWISVFYGFPAFSWIPTHNQNHHRYLNGAGDVTRTSRLSRRDTLMHALVYPVASSFFQAPSVVRYAAQALGRGRARAMPIAAQTLALVVVHGALLLLALRLHGSAHGYATYALAFGVPALFAPWSLMFTNYVQHVQCDSGSRDNHSRNFVSPLSNWLLFNAGYHTVHHENPGTHWSEYPALHRLRAPRSRPCSIRIRFRSSAFVATCWARSRRARACAHMEAALDALIQLRERRRSWLSQSR